MHQLGLGSNPQFHLGQNIKQKAGPDATQNTIFCTAAETERIAKETAAANNTMEASIKGPGEQLLVL